MVPSNISTVCTPYFEETLVGGVLQGRKPSDPRGASAICRRSMWHAVAALTTSFNLPAACESCQEETYEELKRSVVLRDRRKVKIDVLETALKGWVSNTGDEGFGLNSIQTTQSSFRP
jgi:tRNA-specific adenosine deaminase 1